MKRVALLWTFGISTINVGEWEPTVETRSRDVILPVKEIGF